MTANEWVGIAVGVCGISTSLFMGVRFLIKSYLQELKPNGGSSVKDQITNLQSQTLQLQQRVDDLFVLISKR
jgi:hypothetical protein